jgi:beta-galactosidase
MEPERFIPTVHAVQPTLSKEKSLMQLPDSKNMLEPDFDDAAWEPAFKADRDSLFGRQAKWVISRGHFILPETDSTTVFTYYSRNIGEAQSVYINGVKIAGGLKADSVIRLSRSVIQPGKNNFVMVAMPFLKVFPWDEVNKDPGMIQLYTPAAKWQRKLFNGYAQVLVQSTGEKGKITLRASAAGMPPVLLDIQAK